MELKMSCSMSWHLMLTIFLSLLDLHGYVILITPVKSVYTTLSVHLLISRLLTQVNVEANQ